MIHISNLNKTFGSSKGLSHINLHVAPGEMVALIGSSGSGKSTLMRHICGLTAAHHGRVTVSPCVLPIVSQSTSTGAFA